LGKKYRAIVPYICCIAKYLAVAYNSGQYLKEVKVNNTHECQSGPCLSIINTALRTPGEVDFYECLDENGDCSRCGSSNVQYSDDVVYKLDTNDLRCIVVVSECSGGHQLFEEAHQFICVDPANCTADCNFAQA
jgi:hypothetical protein